MLKVSNVKLNIDCDFTDLSSLLKRYFNSDDILSAKLVKKSVDARHKNDIKFVCTFEFSALRENHYLKKYKNVTISKDKLPTIIFKHKVKPTNRPIVVGSGPAGLFSALTLAENGYNPIVIERGDIVENRQKKVNTFWSGGQLDEESNVQFGEGGAGTFSDGKLNTGTKDSYISFVLNEFYENGADEDILYNAKPHIGTDVLRDVVKNLRNKIINLGGEFLFNTKLQDLIIKDDKLTAIKVIENNEEKILPCDDLILAIGHSARDTFKMLKSNNINMQPKPFSVGIRIEHPQSLINKIQYGNPDYSKYLGSADYKTAVHLQNGRSVYSFCMCPGGYVVPSASEKGHLVTNGMSEHKRDGDNANSALLVGITPDDFLGDDVLSGINLQRDLEKKAFIVGGENYFAPVMTVEDFMKNQPCKSIKGLNPTYSIGVMPSDFKDIFPNYILESLREGLIKIDEKMKGFLYPDAILTAVESRSSSPVRILRDESGQANIKGIYPSGEGSGYSGGITSSAVDGIKSAKKLIYKYNGD